MHLLKSIIYVLPQILDRHVEYNFQMLPWSCWRELLLSRAITLAVGAESIIGLTLQCINIRCHSTNSIVSRNPKHSTSIPKIDFNFDHTKTKNLCVFLFCLISPSETISSSMESTSFKCAAFWLDLTLFSGYRTDVKQWRRWLLSPCCFDRTTIDSTRCKSSDTDSSNTSWHRQPTSIGSAARFCYFYFIWWRQWCRHVLLAARVNGKAASRRSNAPTSTLSRYQKAWTLRLKCSTCLVTRSKCFIEDFSSDLVSSTCSVSTSLVVVWDTSTTLLFRSIDAFWYIPSFQIALNKKPSSIFCVQ